MKKFGYLLLLFFIQWSGYSQDIYSKTFGNPKDKAVIFLHGGPGFNCASFEVTAAQAIVNSGLYVIIYDRRGEGRSTDAAAKYNFQETFADLDLIYKRYGIQKATLIGHSFGGVVGTLFMKQFPQKVESLFLVGAPVALQETFKTIIRTCRKIYETNNDKTNLNYIEMLEKMDTTTAEYYTYCFSHAMKNGFYRTKNTSAEAKAIYASAINNPDLKYANMMSAEAPQGFLKNENYTSIDLSNDLKSLVAAKFKIYGMYGKEDGLYSPEQVAAVEQLLGQENVMYLDDCSHNVFIDQQTKFIGFLKAGMK